MIKNKFYVGVISTVMMFSLVLGGCSKQNTNIIEDPTAKSTEEKSNNTEYSKGVITDTTFESEFLNLKFTAPKNFVMAIEDEILSLSDFGTEEIFGENLSKQNIDYVKANTIYEMAAFDATGIPNVSIALEKLKFKNMTEDQYIEALKKTLSLAKTGSSFRVSDTKKQANIAGQEYINISCNSVINGVSMTQDFYLRKQDEKMILFTFTYNEASKDKMNQLMNAFTPYAKS